MSTAVSFENLPCVVERRSGTLCLARSRVTKEATTV